MCVCVLPHFSHMQIFTELFLGMEHVSPQNGWFNRKKNSFLRGDIPGAFFGRAEAALAQPMADLQVPG